VGLKVNRLTVPGEAGLAKADSQKIVSV